MSVLLGSRAQGLKSVREAGEGDSFIKKIHRDGQDQSRIPLGVEWSQRTASASRAVRVRGGAASASHARAGQNRRDRHKVAVPAARRREMRLEIGAGISGDLTPLKFFVQAASASAPMCQFARGQCRAVRISSSASSRRTASGLSIDGGGFTGGGFLCLDPDKGEYAGGLELSFQGIIAVRAVGILSTRMPDGSDGFLAAPDHHRVRVSADPAVAAASRCSASAACSASTARCCSMQLQLGVRDGSLQQHLFPRDVVANAPRIISDLKRDLSADGGPLPDRADGQARLGHARR